MIEPDPPGTEVVIGIDLAWGPNGRTGICVAEDGRVVDSAWLRTDEEICDRIAAYSGRPMLLAVDAPLVVTNLTGQRRAENLVSRLYGAARASAHSSNLGMRAFMNGVRAAELARLLGVPVDPCGPLPAMIEVYPHPALVSLFGLDLSLSYKARRRRTVEVRREAFEQLVGHLESLRDHDPPLDVTTSPRWSELRHVVREAITNGQLDAVEDELDAYVCAYVGLYWLRWRGDKCAVLGSVDEGYIVTPIDAVRAARLEVLREPSRG